MPVTIFLSVGLWAVVLYALLSWATGSNRK